MDCTQVLLTESSNEINTASEKYQVATLVIGEEYHTIYNSENVVGRESGCDIVIDNNAVSSKHAVIEAEDPDAHLIYDLGSTNKTKLGKILLKPHVRYHINDGDYVTFGNVSAQYNISRQYPTTPVKAKSGLNSCSIPETPERPNLTEELIVTGGCKKETKLDNSSHFDTSDTDMFDEKDVSSVDINVINTSKADNDIYELDTLSFDDNDIRETLGTNPHSKEGNITSEKNNGSNSLSNIDPDIYEINTQESDNDRQLSKVYSSSDKDKMKNNEGWEDFPDIASPVGLDTSNADNIDCSRPKLSTSLMDITNDDLKKNQCGPEKIKNVANLLETDEEGTCKLLVAEGSMKVSLDTNATVLEPEKADIEETPDSSKIADILLKPVEYPENDFNIPLSQNTDMFEDTQVRGKTEVSAQEDVYEMLTQVCNQNKDIGDPNDSIYDIQTQIVLPSNESTPKITRYLSRSDILEPATQPFESKVNDQIKNVSSASIIIIDESNQNCSFSSSMLEAATQPCQKSQLFPTGCELKEESSKEHENTLVNTNDTIVKEISFSSMYEVGTQPLKVVEKPQLPDKEISYKKKTNENCSFSTSICDIATQPCPKTSPKIIESTKLQGLQNKVGDSIFSTSLYEAATQPYIQLGIENSCSNQDSVDQRTDNNTTLLNITCNIAENNSFSASMYEAATQPFQQSTADERQKVDEKELKKEAEKTATVSVVIKDNDQLSFSLCEVATQPSSGKDKSLVQKLSSNGMLASKIEINDIEMKKSNFSSVPDETNNLRKIKDLTGETKIGNNELMVEKDVKNTEDITLIIHKNNNAVSESVSFSTSVYEVATQSISEKQSNQDKRVHGEDKAHKIDLDATDESHAFKLACDGVMTDSFFEAATQPAPISSPQLSQNESRDEESTDIVTHKSKQSIVIKSNREMLDVEHPHRNPVIPYHSENDKLSNELVCQIKSSQVSKPFTKNEEEKEDSLVNPISISCEKISPLRIAEALKEEVKKPIADKTTISHEERHDMSPLIKTSSEVASFSLGIDKKKELVKNLDYNFSEGLFQAGTQPLLDQLDINLQQQDETLAEQSETISKEETCSVTTAIISNEAQNSASRVELKFNVVSTGQPHTLSDSFFDAATQPYKDVNLENKTYLDPLTSICDDLSVNKIVEITDELMYGNISANLVDTKNSLRSNNDNKKRSCSTSQHAEVSDDNIYDALKQDPFCSSHIKVLSNKVNDDNIMEKLSTQDLKRILESDDLTHKYDEFRQITLASNKEHISVTNDVIRPTEDRNIEDLETAKLENYEEHINIKPSVEKNNHNNTSGLEKINNAFPPNSQNSECKNVENDDCSQELNFRSNKKRCNIFPPDSQNDECKNVEKDDSSQELNFKSKKKRCNIFPPDSQNDEYKNVESDDSSQELNIRSNKKRCNIFPADSQIDDTQNLCIINQNNKPSEKHNFYHPIVHSGCSENSGTDDSSQKLMVDSNKEQDIFFCSNTEDNTGKKYTKESINDPENESSNLQVIVNEKHDCNLTFDKIVKNEVGSVISNDENIFNNDVDNNLVSEAIIADANKIVTNNKNNEECGPSDNCNKPNRSSKKVSNSPRGQTGEKHFNYTKKCGKEPKNKSPSEREPTYISRGNITLHSPEVLSELEKQFRLTKVAMSPTQLSIVSDDESESSLEVIEESGKGDVKRSVRNQKNVSSKNYKKVIKNSQSAISQKKAESHSVVQGENVSELSESKRKYTDSVPEVSKSEKSFKKFKKISPLKNNCNLVEKVEEKLSCVPTDTNSPSIICNNSDNSQNSEELGRGKRKRTRTSYEGFILEEDKKRTPRKKLSFSQSADINLKDIDKQVLSESSDGQSTDYSILNIKQTVSVVLQDIQEMSKVSELSETESVENQKSKCSLPDKGESSKTVDTKISNHNTSTKDKAATKTKQPELLNKENKNLSFSFTEKLDELFNIWGPADRVKLSPRAAKKSYKLLANGKIDSAGSQSSTSSGKKSDANKTDSNKETKQLKVNSSKIRYKSSINKKYTPELDIRINNPNNNLNFRRKRTIHKNDTLSELSHDSIEKNRGKNSSETSENSIDLDNSANDGSDPTIRKSTRISKKKNLDSPSIMDPVAQIKGEQVLARSTRFNRRQSDQSVENTLLVTSDSGKSTIINSKKVQAATSSNVINSKSKTIQSSKQKNTSSVHKLQPMPSNSLVDDGFCFSQEFSFHESKIEKEKKIHPNDCLPPPLKIRRSERKKNEKNTDKNVEHVMFTGFADKKTKLIVNKLGGQIVESPFTCTVLVTDKIRRTTKFLSALSRGHPIVSPQWLIDSEESGKFMDVKNFLLSDKETEKLFSFNLKKSIEKAKQWKVLDGWSVHVTPSVKPSPEEMKSIIECSGGRFLTKEPARWPTNAFVISCNEDRDMWKNFSKKGKGPIVVETEALFLGVLRQELNLESHRLL